MKYFPIFAVLFIAGCSKPNFVGKWKCDKMIGAPKGSSMSGTFNFKENTIDTAVLFKMDTISFVMNVKYDYSVSGKYLVMKCNSVTVDPKSLSAELLPNKALMEKEMKSELLGKTFKNEYKLRLIIFLLPRKMDR